MGLRFKLILIFASIFYLIENLKDHFSLKSKSQFPNSKILRLQALRTIKGTYLRKFYKTNEIDQFARKSQFLQFCEIWFIGIMAKYPAQFLNYFYKNCYLPSVHFFENIDLNKKQIFLFHNFIGTRIGILILVIYLMKTGNDSIVFVDKPILKFVKYFYKNWILKNRFYSSEEYNNNSIKIISKHFPSLFSKNIKSNVYFFDVNDKKSLLFSRNYFKNNHCNIIMIPESGKKYKNMIPVDYLEAKFSYAKGLTKLLQYSDGLISVVPDARDNIFSPRFIVRNIDIGSRNFENILNSIVEKNEVFSTLNPELYIPFDYTLNWNNFTQYEDDSVKILDSIYWKNEYILLFSNGKMVKCSKKSYKKMALKLQNYYDQNVVNN